jgi:CubicO group peptidase (beta-lactamase class C family)
MISIRQYFVVAALILVAALVKTTTAFATNDSPEAKQVDAIFADLAKPGSPGCALAVARGGKIIYEKGYGLANLEQEVPITPRTVFDIGSTSKQFTASSILLLEKEGKLSVNDDVRKYIPELPDYGKKITILNLLNHTSGIRDYLTLFELAGVYVDSVTTDEDALAIITRQKSLNFDPGSEYLYSNSGYFLLSVIVKRVSGKSLPEFAAENIFTPLSMAQTLYRDQHTQLVPNRALAYDAKDPGPGFVFNVSYFEQTGDGAVHTSVEDLLKWDENFYTAKVGGKAFLDELQETATLNNGKKIHYAKGLAVYEYRGLRAVEHGGSWGGYRAQLLRFPDKHFSVACLCNLGNADPEKRATGVADIFLASDLKPKQEHPENAPTEHPKPETVPLAPEVLAKYAGDYVSEELFVTYTLAVENGKLCLTKIRNGLGDGFLQATRHFELRPVGKEKFLQEDQGINLVFSRGAQGELNGFVLGVGRSSGISFTRK